MSVPYTVPEQDADLLSCGINLTATFGELALLRELYAKKNPTGRKLVLREFIRAEKRRPITRIFLKAVFGTHPPLPPMHQLGLMWDGHQRAYVPWSES